MEPALEEHRYERYHGYVYSSSLYVMHLLSSYLIVHCMHFILILLHYLRFQFVILVEEAG